MIFIDTSAFLALLDMNDLYHKEATQQWLKILEMGNECFTNNYVLIETIAIAQRRLGLQTVRELKEQIVGHVQAIWIDEEQHAQVLETLLETNRRNLSLVDCSAFATMRREGIETVFTFDAHFREQGFRVIP